MIGIDKPSVDVLELSEDGTYGKFTMEPLERGYGTTIGNSLRRVLLSSLPGYAITSVKIDGVLHEFSTVPGVKEDVTEIVLNLKGVILKIQGDGPKTLYVEASGKCEVTAGDIKVDGEVEILNPEMHTPYAQALRIAPGSIAARLLTLLPLAEGKAWREDANAVQFHRTAICHGGYGFMRQQAQQAQHLAGGKSRVFRNAFSQFFRCAT